MCDNGPYIKIGMVIMIRLPLLPLADYDCKLHLRNKEAFWHLPTSAAPEGLFALPNASKYNSAWHSGCHGMIMSPGVLSME
jgi:hypothetical protein